MLIEAMQAGEKGKGFAIVAEEIKKLSQDSRKSSEEITFLLNDINSQTDEVNIQIKEGLQSIENNKESIETSRKTFGKVIDNARMITEQAGSNEITILELKESSDEIIKDVHGISKISENINNSTKEVLDNIESQNEHLDDILLSFKKLNRK